jgi:hypothetical protein
VAWFYLPPPNLAILAKSTERESESTPRMVEKGDQIKIGNWMHRWTKNNFSYELSVLKKEGDAWIPLEGSADEMPLKLDENSNGSSVRVTAPFNGTLKYEVTFGPRNEESRELVETPSAAGYVRASGIAIFPWIVGAMLALTVGFFAWNFFRKK